MVTSSADRAERLARQLLSRRATGEDINDDEIRARFPDIADEIIDWITMLSAISKAERRAALGERLDLTTDEQRADLELLEASFPSLQDFQDLTKGGQSSVWLARERDTGRHLVVKLILDGPLAKASSQRRFEREARILQKLDHPHIVRVIDSGVIRGRQFIVMEFVGVLAIDDHAYGLGNDLDAKLRLFALVCRAIASAHNVGVVHRDLKPSNILVRDDGTPCIIDFGLAKDLLAQRDTASILTSASGSRFGTAAYLSPEQTTAEGIVDRRSDIYALGAVLYEVITDRFPYEGHSDLISVVRNVLTQEPVSLSKAIIESEHVYGASRKKIGRLNDVIRKAMDKDPDRRYQTASELAEEIDRVVDGRDVEASKGAGRRRLERAWLRRRAVIVTAASLVLLSAFSLVFAFFWQAESMNAEDAEQTLRISRAKEFHDTQAEFSSELRDATLPIGNLSDSSAAPLLRHDGNLTDEMLGSDTHRIAKAEEWLEARADALQDLATELHSSILLLEPGDIGGAAGSPDWEMSATAKQAADALLANSLYHRNAGATEEAVRFVIAAVNLASDVGCSRNESYKGEAMKLQFRIFAHCLTQLKQCASRGEHCAYAMGISKVNPALPQLRSAISSLATAILRLAEDSAVDSNGVIMVDLIRFDDRLDGMLSRLSPSWREDFSSHMSLDHVKEILRNHMYINNSLHDMTLSQTIAAGQVEWDRLRQARRESPIAYMCNIYDKRQAGYLLLKAKFQSLRIAGALVEYKQANGHWPLALTDLDLPPALFIDPLTGKLLEYDRQGAHIKLQSPPIAPDHADVAVRYLSLTNQQSLYDGSRFVHFED